jgi:hypothetical protein
MRNASLILLVVAVVVTPGAVFGKPAYLLQDELIRAAEIIAMVDISAVSETETQGQHWTYRQTASARPLRILKGKLPQEFAIHAEKDFICARASYQAGARYLVFLRQEGALYTTINHQMGQFKITDDKLKWFSSNSSLSLEEQPLAAVLGEIHQSLERAVRQGSG